MLPTKEAWTTALHRVGVLTPGLLSGMTVALIYVTGDANGRCPVTLERQVKMFELWHYALGIAGARWIMTSDLPSFYPELKVAVGAKEKK